MDTEERSDGGVLAMYKEAAENHRYVVEWRHKILIRFFLAMAAFFYVAKWIWETGSATFKALTFVPLFLSALASLGFLFIERRNTEIMHINARAAKRLEILLHEEGGFYTDLVKMKPTITPVGTVLRIMYLASTAILIALAVISFIRYTL